MRIKVRFAVMLIKSLASILYVLTIAIPAHAVEYVFTTVAVDFPSNRDDLFGCAITGINDAGVLVGACTDRNQNDASVGFQYDGRKFRELVIRLSESRGPKRVLSAIPKGVNSENHLTGFYLDETGSRGFLRQNKTDITLNIPGSFFTQPAAINDLDQVVGGYRDQNGTHGFIYENGVYTSLDVPFAINDTAASGINNFGQVVGHYTSSSPDRGFLYDPETDSFLTINFPGALST